ncbi:MAG: NAD(P)H-dependent glycerol-3-phosphate dehydrogenase, partial [Xanthomonadales bacterium]|nr:NAD(P)H-dependent glycerol-3-phosphate dehydrogenase [Xanthomonadales bacterium]
MSDRPAIAVLGAGSWGTALAMQLARCDTPTVLWGRSPEHLEDMRRTRRNARYLPEFEFPDGLEVQPDLEAAVRWAEHLLVVTPSHGFGELLECIAPLLTDAQGVAWASKGFEPGSGRFLHQVAEDKVGAERGLAVVTGPSFAHEVAANLPTAVTVAGQPEEFTETIARSLHGGSFRAYTGDDICGAELGGAVKNVLAVATGIADGMKLGNNARAALITRGLAEMMRLGAAMGAEPQTLMGLAGMGDLVLTCTGDLSRNRRLGLALGAGKSVEQAVADIGQVVEGVQTAEEVRRLAERHGV